MTPLSHARILHCARAASIERISSIFFYFYQFIRTCVLFFQTEVTMTGGGRFHQLFSSGLVEPAEAELLDELRGHHHHSFQSSEAVPSVNTGQNAAVSFHL